MLANKIDEKLGEIQAIVADRAVPEGERLQAAHTAIGELRRVFADEIPRGAVVRGPVIIYGLNESIRNRLFPNSTGL